MPRSTRQITCSAAEIALACTRYLQAEIGLEIAPELFEFGNDSEGRLEATVTVPEPLAPDPHLFSHAWFAGQQPPATMLQEAVEEERQYELVRLSDGAVIAKNANLAAIGAALADRHFLDNHEWRVSLNNLKCWACNAWPGETHCISKQPARRSPVYLYKLTRTR